MHRIWPLPAEPVDDSALADLYAHPEHAHPEHDGPDAAPFVRVNFVSSADGAVSVDGLSEGLGTPGDKRVFGLLRELAQVVLVGAGTARAEEYRGARRPVRGTDTPPPIAVVTGSADLDPGLGLFTDTRTPTIVLTTADAPQERRDRLAAAGADVAVLDDLGPAALLAELGRRGLRRVLCEGGPSLHGALIAAGAVDELCLTVSPLLAGGAAGRIAVGPEGSPTQSMTLASALQDEGALLLRYRR